MAGRMAKKPQKIWAKAPPRPVRPAPAEQQAIIAACETFIATVLKPRFLPEVTPTPFNYKIDIRGEWSRTLSLHPALPLRHGTQYRRGIRRTVRSSRPHGPDRFDIYWMRHTGQWWPVHRGLTLAASLRMIEDDPILHPH
jgi:hypothetical protein